MAEQEQDRSEAATPYKLRKAQERGHSSKSQDTIFAAELAAFVLILYSSGSAMAQRELVLSRQIFDHATHSDWSSDSALAWLSHVFELTLYNLVPVLAALTGAAILSSMAQTGPVFSFGPLVPDFQRINPSEGIRRFFSVTILYNTFKSLAKLTALAWALWLIVRQDLPSLMLLSHIDVHAHGAIVMRQIAPMLSKLLLIILILALLDIGYTRWDFAQKMRMSRREVRDELKQREGDPRIRSRLRQLRNELLKKSRALKKIPDADVLITNPVHLAIALSYKHGEMPAPKMLAKGSGSVAKKMREIARKHNIPVVENAPYARELYKRLDTEEYLPEDLYPTAAKILLWVYALRKTRERVKVGT